MVFTVVLYEIDPQLHKFEKGTTLYHDQQERELVDMPT